MTTRPDPWVRFTDSLALRHVFILDLPPRPQRSGAATESFRRWRVGEPLILAHLR
jgi:hypothetical protein